MRFVISVIDSMTRSPHSPDEIKAINDFNDKIGAAGQRLFACGLDSLKSAAVFDNRSGAGIATEGAFIETEEFFSGFWIIEVNDLDTARTLAAEGSRACNRRVELRLLLG